MRLLYHVWHILGRERAPFAFSDPESAPRLAREYILPIFAVLVEARAESVDFGAVLRLKIGRGQPVLLWLVACSDRAPVHSYPHLLMKCQLLCGISCQQKWLRLQLLTSSWSELIAVIVLGEPIRHALTQRFLRI